MTLARRAGAEGLGTALLLAMIVGSGIMGERLAAGNAALALLVNAAATGAGLYVLIAMFGPVSGAHFNPLVSLMAATNGSAGWKETGAYVSAQVAGAFGGVAVSHAMFGLPVFTSSTHSRAGPGQWLAEAVATFGLLLTIGLIERVRPLSVAAAVGAYIFAAYWFAASTSFANPAVTLARAATDTFTGIRPRDTGLFMAAQAIGALAAIPTVKWFRT